MTPIAVYDSQPLYESVEVKGIGESAYFNNGADARQFIGSLTILSAVLIVQLEKENDQSLALLSSSADSQSNKTDIGNIQSRSSSEA